MPIWGTESRESICFIFLDGFFHQEVFASTKTRWQVESRTLVIRSHLRWWLEDLHQAQHLHGHYIKHRNHEVKSRYRQTSWSAEQDAKCLQNWLGGLCFFLGKIRSYCLRVISGSTCRFFRWEKPWRVWMQVKLVYLENRYNKLSDDLWGEETGAAIYRFDCFGRKCWDNFGRKLENCCRDVHFELWIGDDFQDAHASISFFPSPHLDASFQQSIFCMTKPQDYAADQA